MSQTPNTGPHLGNVSHLIRCLKAAYPASGAAALELREHCERSGQSFAGFLRKQSLPRTTCQRLAHLHEKFGGLMKDILPAHVRYNLDQVRLLDRYEPPYQAVFAALEAVDARTGRVVTIELHQKLDEWVSEGLLRRRTRKPKLPGMPRIRRTLRVALQMIKKRGIEHPFVNQCSAFIAESELPGSRIGAVFPSFPNLRRQ